MLETHSSQSTERQETIYVAKNAQEGIEVAGGFGRMQLLIYSVLVTDAIVTAMILYSAPIMELMPEYLCTDPDHPEPYRCQAKDFCGKPEVKYEIDWSHENSLHNWVEHLDMTCSNESEIGMIGALYFAGFLSTIGIAGRLGDIIGRRKIIFVGQSIQTVCCTAFIMMNSINWAKALMFFFGVGQGLNFGLAMFMQEFMM